MELIAMDYVTNMNLASIFRGRDAKLSLEDLNPKEQQFEQRLVKTESRAEAFLIDKKYALQLDELI